MVFAVIFAGGTGSRMQIKTPKQFLKVCGKPILVHTIEKFVNSSKVDKIVIVTLKNYVNRVKNLVAKYELPKILDVIEGGETAFESQINGVLLAKKFSLTKDDIVIIHDGVRPLISSALINNCVDDTYSYKNTVVISPTVETTGIINNDEVMSVFPREKCVIIRAPQAFILDDIYRLHKKAIKDHKIYIDSASMFLDNGYKLHTVNGPVENIKITTKYDYMLLKKILRKE